MTTSTWTLTGTVPLSRWAAAAADLRILLGAMLTAGATVTDPTGTTAPQFTDNHLGFAVQLTGREPLAVTLTRGPSTGLVATTSPVTDGLVLTALARVALHWGQQFTYTSDADLTAQTIRDVVVARLFAAGDRATTGAVEPSTAQVVARYVQQSVAAHDRQDGVLPLPVYLDTVIGELAARRAGVGVALALFPSPVVPLPAPDPEVTPVVPPAEPEPTEEPSPVDPPVDEPVEPAPAEDPAEPVTDPEPEPEPEPVEETP